MLTKSLLLVAIATCTFAQYPAPVVSLNSNHLPKGGYWALEPDPNADPSGQKRHGRMYAVPPAQDLGFLDTGYPIMADWTSQSIDRDSLFYFHDNTGTPDPTNIHRPRILDQNFGLNIGLGVMPPVLFADVKNATIVNFYAYGDTFDVQDSGSYTAIFGTVTGSAGSNGFSVDSASNLAWNIPSFAPYSGTPMRVMFRYYPEGMPVDPLDEGEVALFQSCGFQGPATVFAANTADFHAFTSADLSLIGNTASVRLGNNTALTLYSGANYAGTSQLITTDTDCLDSTPIGRQTTAYNLSP